MSGEPLTRTDFQIKRFAEEATRHAHGFHQLVLPVEGALEMEIEGRGGRAAGEVMAIVPRGQAHIFRGSARNRLLVLDLDDMGFLARRLGALLERQGEDQPFMKIDPSLQALSAALAQEELRLGPRFDRGLAAEYFMTALAARLEERFPPLPEALKRALGVISTGAPDLSVRQLARETGVSEAVLHRLFKDELKVSPARFMAEARLRQAARRLREDDAPLSEIALAAGYSEQASFTRAFTRFLGRSPLRYRQEERTKSR